MVLLSALNSITDPVLYYLACGVLIISGLVLLLLVQVISYRIYNDYRIKTDKRAREIWHPVLAELMLSYPENTPVLKRTHHHEFLLEWNRVYSMLRGDVHERLRKLSRNNRLDKIAHKYIKSRNIGDQLLGIVTLGHMQDEAIWNTLIDFVNSDNSLLSLTAAQALVDINHKDSIEFLLPHIIKRKDWPITRVAMLLNSFELEKLTRSLGKVLTTAHDNDILHILKFLGSSCFDPNIKKLYQRLGDSTDSRVVAACIAAAKDVDGLKLVRKHVENPEWFIRLQVAKVLGHLGSRDDVDNLIKLMSDSEWWVRYRSAQSLAQLPFIDTDFMNELHDKLEDRYARDILQQIISEQEMS